MARSDFCEGCWDSDRESQMQRDTQVISWWQSTVKIAPPQPKEEAIKRSLAEELLRKYLTFPEPRYVNFCYILALMLERRRLLSPKHTVQEAASGKTIIIYEHAKTGETILIKDPHLTMSQIGKVQVQVKEILDSEQKAREAEQPEPDTEISAASQDQTQEESEK
jgi:hypothetical protein